MSLLSIFLFVLTIATKLEATTVSVGCAGSSGTFDFTSVNDALSSLASTDKRDDVINISGICTETVVVDDWDNLQLIGTNGAGIFAPASLGGNIGIIEVLNSKKIGIQGLKFRGTGATGPSPVFVLNSSVNVFQCILENGGVLAGGGMFVQGHSNVLVHATTIQDNSPNGIRVDGPALVQVGDVSTEPTPSVLQGNAIGILARGGGLANIHGNTIIRSNRIGVQVSGGEAVFCCGDGQRQVLDNRIGISVVTGGKLETIGPVLVQGNAAFGVSLLGGNATIGEGNTIQQNGRRIQVRGSANLQLSGGSVVNNTGVGIVVRDDSSAAIDSELISGNGEGIRVLILSSVSVTGMNTVTGNLDADMSCSPDSFGYGDRAAIGTLHCPHFGVDPVPGP
jgi:hypothetical protein